MKKIILTLCIIYSCITNSNSQTFTKHGFKYDGICELEKAIDTVDEKGDIVTAFRCVNQPSPDTMYIHSVIVISFKTKVTDAQSFYNSLKKEYSNLGVTTLTTLGGMKAVQVIENINYRGKNVKQARVTILYKGDSSITIMLGTNSSAYNTVLSNFKKQISFL